jgi:putative transposase
MLHPNVACMTISKELLDELLKRVERPEDLLSNGGLMKELKFRPMEQMLGAELTVHVGYEAGKHAPPGQSNWRNGSSTKVLKGQDGELAVPVPVLQLRAGASREGPAQHRRGG